MTNPRIHITGASCTGVTTLGARLAAELGVPHVDTDDFFWHTTDPPYTTRRPRAERLALIAAARGVGSWVISGSLDGWGDPLVTEADLIVFLTAPEEVRLERLRAREASRFGARIGPGGDMEALHASFLIWAGQYDDSGFTGHSRLRHEAWLCEQAAPILRLDGREPLDSLSAAVLAVLA